MTHVAFLRRRLLLGAWAALAFAGQPAHADTDPSTAVQVRQPDVRAQFEKLGAEPVENTPAEFSAFTRAELAKWAAIVKASGAKVD